MSDISIEIADVDGEKQFEVLSTNGDTFWAVKTSISASLISSSASSKKTKGLTLSNDVLALQRLKEAAEKPKSNSNSTQTDINLPYITADASALLTQTSSSPEPNLRAQDELD